MDDWKQLVSKWISIDDKIIDLQNQISDLREIHDTTTDDILDFVETNKMEDKTVRISGGEIIFKETKRTKSTSIKMIEEALKMNGIAPANVIDSISTLKKQSAETDLLIIRKFT